MEKVADQLFWYRMNAIRAKRYMGKHTVLYKSWSHAKKCCKAAFPPQSIGPHEGTAGCHLQYIFTKIHVQFCCLL